MAAPARLKRRAEFRAVAKGHRASRPCLTLQARPRDCDAFGARVGLTVTKKTGNSVVRSRIKRRFRAACADLADAFDPRTDYVVVARRAALTAPYAALVDDLRGALNALQARSVAQAAQHRAAPNHAAQNAAAQNHGRTMGRETTG